MLQTLILYTREPIDNILYDPRLAYSMHLGYVDENQNVIPLNHNSGVFFAKASENEDGSLNPKSLINPFVEEGTFALKQKDCLYITFSAAAVDTSYVVSYLEIDADKDLLVPNNWIKNNYPILTVRSVSGEYGTGHNAYVTDEMGAVRNTYHARFGTEAPRSSSIRRVHFDIDGAPMLDVTEEHDCKENLSKIHCSIEIV